MYAVTYKTLTSMTAAMIVRVLQDPAGAWVVAPVGGGSGGGPMRAGLRVNFTAQGGRAAGQFTCGGSVIGESAELAHTVRLSFADGTTAEDTVGNGIVLFYIDHSVRCPAEVTIVDGESQVLNRYSEFARLA
jgi:hypothetical protein